MLTKLTSKKYSFDSAHYLNFHAGKCKNLHGHTWTLQVTLGYFTEFPEEFLIDFATMSVFCETIIEKFDHQFLNNFYDLDKAEHPTAERISSHILAMAKTFFQPFLEPTGYDYWMEIQLQEGNGGTVTQESEVIGPEKLYEEEHAYTKVEDPKTSPTSTNH